MLALEFPLEKSLRHICAGELCCGLVPGNLVTFDRTLGQTLLKFSIASRKLGESIVSGNGIAFDRTLGQTLLEFRIRSRQLGESVVPGNGIAFDRTLGQTLLQFGIGARKFGDGSAACGDIAPSVRDYHNDAQSDADDSTNAKKRRDHPPGCSVTCPFFPDLAVIIIFRATGPLFFRKVARFQPSGLDKSGRAARCRVIDDCPAVRVRARREISVFDAA